MQTSANHMRRLPNKFHVHQTSAMSTNHVRRPPTTCNIRQPPATSANHLQHPPTMHGARQSRATSAQQVQYLQKRLNKRHVRQPHAMASQRWWRGTEHQSCWHDGFHVAVHFLDANLKVFFCNGNSLSCAWSRAWLSREGEKLPKIYFLSCKLDS